MPCLAFVLQGFRELMSWLRTSSQAPGGSQDLGFLGAWADAAEWREERSFRRARG